MGNTKVRAGTMVMSLAAAVGLTAGAIVGDVGRAPSATAAPNTESAWVVQDAGANDTDDADDADRPAPWRAQRHADRLGDARDRLGDVRDRFRAAIQDRIDRAEDRIDRAEDRLRDALEPLVDDDVLSPEQVDAVLDQLRSMRIERLERLEQRRAAWAERFDARPSLGQRGDDTHPSRPFRSGD